ncbi:MAG: fluoride efflux transporter CrcB [Gammaproteobacteria bacterium]|jgi:fluoride exporter|nr:fluoride efflux transporter CrcB [Gammaproteobacteria bacterium]MBT4146515.1 fluoride efflux transporter CrcB [Gammaproteobacteria bacterium]MBT5222292.1 fluoride efflux transporter CrcB [Gammaproteobacteria bacterium]MBT5825503.1 fluoride efflux transporter CrcB [Gammaproteobacteria bacterium]MBT5967492.1 fluoride efflux transporter CrcB [Gammaproteobacteria bacterium]
MNPLIAIAFGGACGAVLRFLVSSGVYQWLGRGFPYGTLTVNVLGSFLIGLLTEVLVLQRIAITMEYRSAILVGLFGSFTTFSTFSLETLFLIEQGNLLKAALNILISVCACVFAVWIGLLAGRGLFSYSGGVIRWMGWIFPYALVVVNALVAFLIGLVAALLIYKSSLSEEYRAALLIVIVGMFATLSSLYVVLYLIEEGHQFEKELNMMLSVFLGNALLCGAAIWGGLLLGKQI